jgi:hypothetical protein
MERPSRLSIPRRQQENGRTRWLVWLFVVLAGAVFVGATWSRLSAHQDAQSSSQTDKPATNSPGRLMTHTRDRLAICVDVAGSASLNATTLRGTVQTVLASLQVKPRWVQQGLNKGSPLVEVGCQHEPVMLQPGVIVSKSVTSTRFVPSVPIVREPSKYVVMLFVLSDVDIDRLFFNTPPSRRTSEEEVVCPPNVTPSPVMGWRDSRCSVVTTGLYVSEGEVRDEGVVSNALGLSLGVLDRRTVGEPSPTPSRAQR